MKRSAEKEQSPAFQFYVKEWRSSRAVLRMTFAQRGMYLEMLLEQWESFTLPDDPDACAELIGGTPDEWQAAWPVLRRKFVSDDPGRIYNMRLELVRLDRRHFASVSAGAARKGGLARAKSASRRADGTYSPAELPAVPASATASDLICTASTEVSAEPLRDSAPPVLTFPTTGPERTWALSRTRIDEWTELFPHVDVLAECRKAKAWTDANPQRRKTARGMPAFIVRWLTRANDSGRGNGRGRDSDPVAKPDMRGHYPPCATNAECLAKVFADAKTRKDQPA